MCCHVGVQIWDVSKCLVTDCALVGGGWAVSRLVLLQVGLLTETLLANLTLERTLTCTQGSETKMLQHIRLLKLLQKVKIPEYFSHLNEFSCALWGLTLMRMTCRTLHSCVLSPPCGFDPCGTPGCSSGRTPFGSSCIGTAWTGLRGHHCHNLE